MIEVRLSPESRPIGPDHRPFVIAELSGNHGGKLDVALEILDAVAAAGADAVKLQTYTADSMTIDHDGPGFLVESGPWAGRTLHDLYREAATPYDWHEALFARGRERGVLVFSSPFDIAAVDFLEGLGAPCYKVASPEVVDIPLIERIAATGKPVVLSTGMADLVEVGNAVATLRHGGCTQLVILHCVSGYPTPVEEMNLATMAGLATVFDVPVGLSDHSLGIDVPIAAAALGACAIEKHVTLRRADGAIDAFFSLEPDELAALVRGTAAAHAARGAVRFDPVEAEMATRQFRRSLYVVADVAAGEPLTPENVRSIRPGFGLPPADLRRVLGRRATRDLRRGEPLSWDLVGAPVVADAPSTVPIDGGELRILTPDDVTEAYVDGLNDPEVHRYLMAPRLRTQTIDGVRAFVAANRDDAASILYGLFVDDTLRGTVRLSGIGPDAAADIGIALFDRTVWGQGWGRRAIEAASKVAESLGVAQLVAGIAAQNEASRRAFAAAGYVHDRSADHEMAGFERELWRRTVGSRDNRH